MHPTFTETAVAKRTREDRPMAQPEGRRISHAEILQLKRWSTPTVYNGWEQVTQHDQARECFNLEAATDWMPEQGPLVGRALTVVCQPGDPEPAADGLERWKRYFRYVAEQPGPKVVVVKDLDQPRCFGVFRGK